MLHFTPLYNENEIKLWFLVKMRANRESTFARIKL